MPAQLDRRGRRALVSDGITLKNGGFIQSNNEGSIHPNRGITVGTGGGTLYGSSPLIINSPVVSTGGNVLTIAGPTTSQNIDFEAVNAAFPATVINTGFVAFNADTAGGTITMDPTFEKISIGKHEGNASTISNNINMLSGGLIDLRVASTTVGVAGSILNGSTTEALTIAGKITGPGSFFKGYDTTNGGNTLDGTVIFTNNTNDFTGNLTINFGTVVAAASNALGSSVGHTQVGPLGTLSVKNNINSPERVYSGGIILNTDNNTFTGAMQMTGDTTIDTTLTGTSVASSLKLASGISGVHTLTKNGVGTGNDLEVQNIRATALTVNAGRVTVTPNSLASGVSVLRNPNSAALTVSGTLLDLTNNKLILSDSNSVANPSQTTGTWDAGSSMYTGVTGLVATGRNGGGWAGTSGIITSQTSATTGNFTSIGVATASDVRPATATATGTLGRSDHHRHRHAGDVHLRRRRQPRRQDQHRRLHQDRLRHRRRPDRLVQRRLQLRRQGQHRRLHHRHRRQHRQPGAASSSRPAAWSMAVDLGRHARFLNPPA